MYTTASIFFKTLAEAGITHAFVNWGSDHPALLEELQRQRVEHGKTSVEIVTCPNEYVALSAAHGYGMITSKPAAVIVHVDVGTQALGGAVHNADRAQVPVFIFAGAVPFTANGELRGSRNEYVMWWQDVPDQPAIVRQYTRYTAQIQSSKNAAKVMMRALQIATSQPKGPVYLWARREVLDEDVDEATLNAPLSIPKWPSVTPPALNPHAVDTIAQALKQAEFPLIVAGNVGRNPAASPVLAELSNTLAVGIISFIPSAAPVPSSHPYYLGCYLGGKLPYVADADVLLFLDIDLPWVDAQDNAARPGAKVFVVGNDPLKRTFGFVHVDADMICTADSEVALGQLLDASRSSDTEAYRTKVQARKTSLEGSRAAWRAQLSHAETLLAPDGILPSVPFLLAALRTTVEALTPSAGKNVLWLNEAASQIHLIWNHIGHCTPKSVFTHGGTSLGAILGMAIGASLGCTVAGEDRDLIVAFTGDGNYLFAAPESAYWVARRYNTPFLTIVLNNRGWFSPKHSMRGVHPTGHGSRVSGERLTVGFGQEQNVDYAGVAAAAGGAWARQVARADELKGVFEEAVKVVTNERRCAVVECIIESI
ncbi:thiamine diphosphate-binding protein [Trametes elegans]|nr:thiamine diphosphate-binding protein [Trametes elegans]